jgi:Cof subfamily protein (haloacid dehalogenase superfamily)
MLPKLIFSDLDGTLLNNQHQITPKTQQAILRAVAAGSKFIPVSARMPTAIAPILQNIGLITPLIAYNGALIRDAHDRSIKSMALPVVTAQSICNDVEQHFPNLVWNIYGEDRWAATNNDQKWVPNEEKIVGLQAQRLVTIAEIAQFKLIHKVLLMGESESVKQAESLIKQHYPKLSIARSSPNLIEITAGGVEKRQAVSWLTNYYQVRPEETIAFGDNYNDLGMLATVGTGYVMGNAPQEIKKRAGKLTADNDHDGIAAVLQQWF